MDLSITQTEENSQELLLYDVLHCNFQPVKEISDKKREEKQGNNSSSCLKLQCHPYHTTTSTPHQTRQSTRELHSDGNQPREIKKETSTVTSAVFFFLDAPSFSFLLKISIWISG